MLSFIKLSLPAIVTNYPCNDSLRVSLPLDCTFQTDRGTSPHCYLLALPRAGLVSEQMNANSTAALVPAFCDSKGACLPRRVLGLGGEARQASHG